MNTTRIIVRPSDTDGLSGVYGHGGAEPRKVEVTGLDDGHSCSGQQLATLRIFSDRQRMLGDLAFPGRVGEDAAQVRRQCVVTRPVDQEQGDAKQMPGEADMFVLRMQVEVHHVGERVLLGIDDPLCHHARQVGDVDEHRPKAQPAKRGLVLGIVERAQAQADAVGRRSDWPHGVADMADAIVPPAQDPIVRGGRHSLGDGGGFGFPDMLARFGIERRLYTAGSNKARLDPFSPEKPEDVAFVQELLDALHERFKAWVRSRRGDRLKGDEAALFDGSFMLGERALQCGLIDGLADIDGLVRKLGGERMKTRVLRPRRRGLLRRLPGLVVDALLDAIEERSWRSGLGR